MKKNKKGLKSKIPKFTSYEEEAHFWDTHSVTDFEDETEDVKIVMDLAKPRDDTIVIRVHKSLKDDLERAAARKGINVSTLARIWFVEKLSQKFV